MGKLVLYLPGNGFHANVGMENYERMIESKAGLVEVAQSGLPIALSYQGIDFELFPWIREITKNSKIEWVNASYSHTLLPFVSKEVAKWEIKNLIPDCIPVTFFSEFYAPEESLIPTEFFFVLEGASYLYSACTSLNEYSDIVVDGISPETKSIKYGKKIGIMLRESFFKPILDAFFRMQRDPLTSCEDGRLPVEYLLDQIEAIGNGDKTVVCPLDLEAPYVGSVFGAKIWEIFFDGVKRRGLEDVFVPLSSVLDELRQKAVPSRRPHRSLVKWTQFEVQVKYLMNMSQIRPITAREKLLYAIAGTSDVLAAWERKIGESKKVINLSGKNPDKKSIEIPVSYNQNIIDVQLAARDALIEGKPFAELLKRIPRNNIFIKRMIAYANEHGL